MKKWFSILARVHRGEEFSSADEVQEFEDKLEDLVKRGFLLARDVLRPYVK